MDKDFQTSFIPKRAINEGRVSKAQTANFLTIIALFVLLTVLLSTGALFFYKESIKKNISNMQNELVLAQQKFDSSEIDQYKVLDKRLKAAKEILQNHVAVTPIFQSLEDLTEKSVRYTNFSYSLGTADQPNILVKMSGVAIGYRSIALQSDLYAKNKNIIDPVFSNLSLDDSGRVTFDLQFLVNPSFLNYKPETATSSNVTP